MKGSKTVVFGVTVLVALVFASVSAGLAMGSSASRPATVASGSSGLGRIIVDSHGRTLYLFEKDRRGASACSGACAAYWPPLLTKGATAATKGAKRSLLGSMRRCDRQHQITFDVLLLYF